jgi:AraC-like DNA-binding protein
MGHRSFADPNHALFFNAGDTFRISHPVDGGDVCTVFQIGPTMLESLFAVAGYRTGDSSLRFPRGDVRVGGVTFMTHQRLVNRLQQNDYDSLMVDEVSAQVLVAVISGAGRASGVRKHPGRSKTVDLHSRMVEDVKAYLGEHFRQPLTLCGIARNVGYSPYHLARIFKRGVDLPIHRYLNQIRLRAAVEELLDGAESLSRLALDLGFASHSHFSSAFRREFGIPPSRVRLFDKDSLIRSLTRELPVRGSAEYGGVSRAKLK